MGCDIHLYIEKRNKEGKWEPIDIPASLMPDDRHYKLFSFLADVRTEGVWELAGQVSGRGIPEDCSISQDLLGDVGHNQTYAYLDEIIHLPWEAAGLADCYFYIFCEYILPRLIDDNNPDYHEEKRNIRIIIWFDS